MNPRMLADAILIFHALFILFAIFGGLLTYRNGRWRKTGLFLHIVGAAWAVTVVTMGWTCPLTPLEQQLRNAAGQQGYTSSFIEHYLLAAIYPDGLTRPIQIVLGVGVLVINILIYGLALFLKQKASLAGQ